MIIENGAPEIRGEERTAGLVAKVVDSNGDPVYFHPDNINARYADHGKPYTILSDSFRVELTPHDEIYTRFRLRYGLFRPTGVLERVQIVTETAADTKVFNTATNLNDWTTDASGLSTAIGYDLADVCAASQGRFNTKRELVVEADTIWHHEVAMAYLHYLVKRYANPRQIVHATAGLSAIDLEPGYVVRFSNDCTLLKPRMDYWNEPAKDTGWEELDFIVLDVVRDLNAMTTSFMAEQIVYDPPS